MAEQPVVPVKRKAKIGRIIRRVHNIGKYESVEIVVSQEDEIEFGDVAERQKKCENLTKLMIQDMQRTEKQVFKELGQEPKMAFVKTAADLKDDSETKDVLGE